LSASRRDYEVAVKLYEKVKQGNDEQKAQKWEQKIEDLEA